MGLLIVDNFFFGIIIVIGKMSCHQGPGVFAKVWEGLLNGWSINADTEDGMSIDQYQKAKSQKWA